MSSQQTFSEAVTTITSRIAGKPVDGNLESYLNESFPPGGEAFDDLAELCRQGIDEGWLCNNEHGGIRYGRVIEHGPETNGFSVDVVLMDSIKGPYHGHPNGEIDLCFAVEGAPSFDGNPEGWTVYKPGTWHVPTVTNGRMGILYFLPEGAIEFTRKPPSQPSVEA